MYIEIDQGQVMGAQSFEAHLKEVGELESAKALGDLIDFSEEALEAFKAATIEPIKSTTFTLEHIEQRINVVREEIAQVWNSALPEEEKWRQISAKENEISLLQAGQFSFAKAGFSLSV